MLRRIVLAVIGLFLSASVLADEGVTRYERFQLWNSCAPVRLAVSLTGNFSNVELTKETFEIMARGRLRAARIYSSDKGYNGTLLLTLSINLGRESNFVAMLEVEKLLTDIYEYEIDTIENRKKKGTGPVFYPAITWQTFSYGTYGNFPDAIVSTSSQHVDRFVDEYLRINSSACISKSEGVGK